MSSLYSTENNGQLSIQQNLHSRITHKVTQSDYLPQGSSTQSDTISSLKVTKMPISSRDGEISVLLRHYTINDQSDGLSIDQLFEMSSHNHTVIVP